MRAVFSFLFKRSGMFVLVFLASLGACSIFSNIFFSTYTAKAKLIVTQEAIGPSQEGAAALSEKALNRTAAIIKSRPMIEEVVKELNLKGSYLDKGDIVDNILSMISVRPFYQSDTLDILVKSQKPEVASQIANALCKMVVTSSAKEKFAFDRDIVDWVAGQSAEIRKKMDSSQAKIFEFKKENNLSDPESEYNINKEKLQKLQSELNNLSAQIGLKEAEYKAIKNSVESGQAKESLPQVLSDPEYKEARLRYEKNKAVIEELLRKYQPDHPDVVNIKGENTGLEAVMAGRVTDIVVGTEAQYNAAKAREKELSSMIKDINDRQAKLDESLSIYRSLQQDILEQEKIYNAFLEKINKDIMGGLRINNISLLEQAYIPARKKGIPVSILIIAGFVISLIFVSAYETLKGKGAADIALKEKNILKDKGMYIEKVKDEQDA